MTTLSLAELSKETLLRVLDVAPYGTALVASDGCLVFANAQFDALFGYTRGELLGQGIEILLPERYRSAHPVLRNAYVEAPDVRQMGGGRLLVGLHRSGGEFPLKVSLAPIPHEQGPLVLAVVSDISASTKLERELKQANADLEEFSYVASHDLKSPLRGIADLVQWIREDLGDDVPTAVKKNLDRIAVRIQRMERMIGDLLAYARAGRSDVELELVDPQALIDGILDMLVIPPGFTVHVRVDAAPFKTARIPLETVLRNLINNAITHHDRTQGRIDIRVSEDDSDCVFSVADDGPGIPLKSQARIFKLFQTLSAQAQEHSGIGLALSKRLVEVHGGRIALDAADGARGARFQFWWPRFTRRDVHD